jgi:hypothetical protein
MVAAPTSIVEGAETSQVSTFQVTRSKNCQEKKVVRLRGLVGYVSNTVMIVIAYTVSLLLAGGAAA